MFVFCKSRAYFHALLSPKLVLLSNKRLSLQESWPAPEFGDRQEVLTASGDFCRHSDRLFLQPGKNDH